MIFKEPKAGLREVVHAFNPSAEEVEVGRSLTLRPAWSNNESQASRITE